MTLSRSLRLSLAVVAAVALWASGVSTSLHTARAQSDDTRNTLRVTGEGTVRVAPDRASVRFGIVTEAETAEAARQQNAEAASAALNAVRDLGVPEARIQMQTLSLQPRREYDPDTERYEERGYEAQRRLVVDVDSLDRVPTLVTRVVQQGANRLEGVSYDLQDRRAVRNEALQAAASNARSKADALAETLGVRIVGVRSVREQDRATISFNTSLDVRGQEAASAPEPDAYAPGEIDVSATVEVVFTFRNP
jgi:hypothetical protein